MKRVIHFSGGQTSAYMTLLLKPTENDIVLFCDTGREHPLTYKFLNDFEAFEGIKIHRAAYTHIKAPGLKGFDALIERKKYLPNRVKRICTVELKINTARRYLKSLGISSYESYVGFRYDEPMRVLRHPNRWKKVTNKFPLYEMGINKAMVNEYWNKKNYRLEIPSILGNCDCCFLKGKNALINIFKMFPELADKWISDESKISARGNYTKPATYIKDISYKSLLEASKKIQTLNFNIEDLKPAFNCTCTT